MRIKLKKFRNSIMTPEDYKKMKGSQKISKKTKKKKSKRGINK